MTSPSGHESAFLGMDATAGLLGCFQGNPRADENPSSGNLLAEAVRLARSLPAETSTALAPVFDEHLCQAVPSWRNADSSEHPIHKMMPRVGGLPPALARYFIAAYSHSGETVLDPYCGKGTVLLEAVCMGRRAVGGDIALDAVVATRAKCAPVTVSQVANYLQELRVDGTTPNLDVPSDVRTFYHPRTLVQLLSIREQLLRDMQIPRRREVATFVCGVLLGILHGHSNNSLSLPCNQCFAMSPRYVRRYAAEHNLKRPIRDVRACLLDRSLAFLPRPRAASRARVFEAPAMECPAYARGINDIALVLTSPPYLNRQTYAKDGWLRLWFLKRSHRDVARRSSETGSISLFVEAMKEMFLAVHQVLRPGGVIAVVGGQARTTVRGRSQLVNVADLCAYACSHCEASTELRIERLIRDPKIMTRGSYFAVYAGKDVNGNSPRVGQDEILVVRKSAR